MENNKKNSETTPAADPGIRITIPDTGVLTPELKSPSKINPTDYLLLESKKSLKAGFFRKVVSVIEKFYTSETKLTAHETLRLFRRLVKAIIKILNKLYLREELARPELARKLLDRVQLYIGKWHRVLLLLSSEPKKKHEQTIRKLPIRVLEDLSGKYPGGEHREQEISESGDNLSRLENTSQDRLGYSLFGRSEIKKMNYSQVSNVKGGEVRRYLNDIVDDNSVHIQNETWFGEERKTINMNFELEEFFSYYTQTTMLWGIYFKKMKKFKVALKYFLKANEITKRFEQSLNPDILHSCISAKLQLAIFYFEVNRNREAIDVLDELINLAHNEIVLRVSRKLSDAKVNPLREKAKFQNCLHMFMMILLNLIMNYEALDNYHGVIETFRMVLWFQDNYIEGEELAAIFAKIYKDNLKKYEIYLREVGELEQVALLSLGLQISNANDANRDKNDGGQTDRQFFDGMNDFLYYRYGYDKVNKEPKIVIRPKPGSQEYLEDHIRHDGRATPHGKGVGPAPSVTTNPDTPDGLTIGRRLEDNGRPPAKLSEPQLGSSQLGGSQVGGGGTPQGRKRRKLKRQNSVPMNQIDGFVYGIDKPLVMTTDKYFMPSELHERAIAYWEKKDLVKNKLIGEMQFGNKKSPATFIGKNVNDIDQYFGNVIVGKIEADNDSRGFQLVKKHYYRFKDDEDFDKKEFHFTRKMLMEKGNEDRTEITDKLLISSKKMQLLVGQDVQTEGYFAFNKAQVENMLHRRKTNKAEAESNKTVQNVMGIASVDGRKSARDLRKAPSKNVTFAPHTTKAQLGNSQHFLGSHESSGLSRNHSAGFFMSPQQKSTVMAVTNPMRLSLPEKKDKRNMFSKKSYLNFSKDQLPMDAIKEDNTKAMSVIVQQSKDKIQEVMDKLESQMNYAEQVIYNKHHPRQPIKVIPNSEKLAITMGGVTQLADSAKNMSLYREMERTNSTMADIVKLKKKTEGKSKGSAKLIGHAEKLSRMGTAL